MPLRFLATCAQGTEKALAAELRALGATNVVETRAGALFAGEVEDALRALVWLRTASRVLLPMCSGEVAGGDDLQDLASGGPWADHLGPQHALIVHVRGELTPTLRSPLYAAQRVKDAVVDAVLTRWGGRPSVSRDAPDVRVHVSLTARDERRGTVRARVSLDLAGEGLHRRGYRQEAGEAPLRETLGAACVLLARLDRPDGPLLVDPLCGSGTLVLEAALARAAIAPGVVAELGGAVPSPLAIERLPAFDAAHARALHGLRAEALAAARARVAELSGLGAPLGIGADRDRRAVAVANANARRAGVGDLVRFFEGEATAPDRDRWSALAAGRPLAALFNPPYGERIGGARVDAGRLALDVREALATLTPEAWAIAAEGPVAQALGLGGDALRVRNGALPCRFGRLPRRAARKN